MNASRMPFFRLVFVLLGNIKSTDDRVCKVFVNVSGTGVGGLLLVYVEKNVCNFYADTRRSRDIRRMYVQESTHMKKELQEQNVRNKFKQNRLKLSCKS